MAESVSSIPSREVWSFYSPGQIVFGRHAVGQLGEIARQHGYGRVLLVTDPVLVKVGLAERVAKPLVEAGIAAETFSGGEPEPSMQAIASCVAQAKEFRPDALVAVGGGSNMDLAKLAAVLLAHGGQPRDYVGDGKVPGPVAPLICVPTTAGTGSEVSMASVITDTENKMKVGVLSNYLRPRVALVDPLLTVPCPPRVTADSGIDALTHAIEAYTAVDNREFPLPAGEKSVYQGKHLLADCLAEKAIALVGQHLRRAVADGNDLEAREGMALAALLAGMAFSNVGVAAVHALEYPLGTATRTPHGRGNGLLLPFVMRFNLPARVKEFARIAQLLGQEGHGVTEQEAAERAITAVELLRADIGIPQRLRDIGVEEGQLRGFAEKAFNVKRVLRVNPRPVTVEDLEGILRAAF